MSSFTDRAIILKKQNLGEADKILTLLTKHHGKVPAVAKGVRKTTSRKGGNLELFNLVEAKITESKKLAIITEASALDSFEILKGDLQKIGQAYYICELVHILIPEDKSASEVFPLILKGLKFLNENRPNGQIEKFMKDFEIELLKLSGFWSDKMFTQKKPQTLEEWRRFNRIFIEQILGAKLNSPHFLKSID